jgi:CheY-like chemotaxis protein
MEKSVLIVEDEEPIRELYSDALEGVDLHVHKASNGGEGIELALKHHPDVILMDIIMPGMSGHKAVQEIRKDNWGKEAHIIFLTNMSDAEDVVKAVAQGSEEYIIKANTPIHDVINKVRTAMNLA